jgi:hypothetical protein
VTVLDDQGRVVERWALRQTEQALAETLARLGRHGEPAEVPVIIERSAGRTDATGCAGFNPWIQGWGNCRPWSGCVRIHVRARTAASNQLGALLDAHWPGPRPCSPSWPATSRWPS